MAKERTKSINLKLHVDSVIKGQHRTSSTSPKQHMTSMTSPRQHMMPSAYCMTSLDVRMTFTNVCKTLFIITLVGLVFDGAYGHYDCDHVAKPRLCDGDYSTPGLCITLVEDPRQWWAAEEYCENEVPHSSQQVTITDQQMHDLVSRELADNNVQESWMGAFLAKREWIWQNYWEELAYQGCYRDDPNNPDLPIDLGTYNRPVDCIDACSNRSSLYASVQMVNQAMRCRCSHEKVWRKKYEAKYDAECDTPCGGGLTQTTPINARCGGVNRQIVFRTEGTRFQAWAPTNKRFNAECVSLDDTNNHFWVERHCSDRIGHICQYEHDETHCKQGRVNTWVVDRCVTIHNQDLTFYEAQVECSKYAGRLMLIDSAEVFTELRSHLDNSTPYYFALTHEAWVSANWDLIDSYFNWGQAQPATGTGQDCLMMKGNDDYTWYNVDCDSLKPFVCLSEICVHVSTDNPDSSYTDTTGDYGMTTIDRQTQTPIPDPPRDSDDLYKGIGIGVGGTLVVLILVLLLLCVIRKLRKKKAKGNMSDKPTTRGLPAVPTNPSFEPDIINDHGESAKPHQVAGGVPGNRKYEDMEPGYDHTYDRINRQQEDVEEEYIEPVSSMDYQTINQ